MVGAGAVIDQVRALVAGGTAEIVLSGVDLTSWGQDLPGRPRLGRLVRQILAEVPDLPRLRLSSIDPAEPDAELMAVLAEEERLMPHLHLSVQHGDDLILKRMKRRHLARDVLRFCEEARRRRPGVVFGADMIAGFPTETEPAHQNSLSLIEQAGLMEAPKAKIAVLDGTANRHSRIALHVFSDSIEPVILYFLENGAPFSQEQRQIRWFDGSYRTIQLIVFELVGAVVELSVFEPVHLRQAPPSPIDGKPQRRATLAEAECLLVESTVLRAPTSL